MRVLGVDLGTNLGWALLERATPRAASKVVESGAVKLRSSSQLDRLSDAAVAFGDLMEKLAWDDVVAYEKVRRHLGTAACHVYGALEGLLLMAATLFGARDTTIVPVSVQAVKKLATGAGNADKAQVLAAARRKFRVRTDSYDEADALWIAEVGMEEAFGNRKA